MGKREYSATEQETESPVTQDRALHDEVSDQYGSSNASLFGISQTNGEKRKRVARACDNCRQKKVKCDGKQPCIHCTVYSYKCSYMQPNIRNKKVSGIPIPAQSSPIIQMAAAAAGNTSGYPGNKVAPVDHNTNIHSPQSSMINGDTATTSNIAKNLIQCQNLFNILLPKLKLNCLDENNPLNLDFEKLKQAYSYAEHNNRGRVVLDEVCENYNNDSPGSPSSNSVRSIPSLSYVDDGQYGREIKLIIPSKEVALQLIYTTWNKACVLFRFYHRPSLLEEVDLLYSLDPSAYGDRQQKFLPFLYSLLACGSLFSKTNSLSSDVNENLEDDGFKYFLEARKLIDISNVGDIHSIQTVVMMIMYLQCSARLSTCYSYVGIALRSALKEGLHRNLSIFQSSKRKLDPIEADTRKRLFYTIYKMDIYINSLLGLPRSIDEDEFDQEFPEELDDENITRDAYLHEMQNGRLSSSACANHHTKLLIILSHIVKKLYPVKVRAKTNVTPDHIHNKVTELEIELKQWLQNLPKELKPTDPNDPNSTNHIPEKFIMANYYMHLAFLNCQIMLYRPFIHFISNGSPNIQSSDARSLIRGRNCIKVARMVVKLSNKMIDQNLLVGTYWFSMYTIFFSVACLVYYYHFANYSSSERGSGSVGVGGEAEGMNYAGVLFDDDLNIDMIKEDIEIGKKVLDCLKNNSNSSLRIYNILNVLFEQLNRRTASTSKLRDLRDPKSVSLENGQRNSNPFKNQNEHVRATFNNFNKMNEYSSTLKANNGYNPYGPDKTNTKQENDMYAFQSPFNSKDYHDEVKSFPEGGTLFKKPNDGVIDTSNPINPVKDSLFGLPAKADIVPAPRSVSRSNSENSNGPGEQVDYLPGVIDRLDAQIFGKILPPYMLEKNAQNSNGSPESLFKIPEDNVIKSQPRPEEDLSFNDVDLNNIDFSLLDDAKNLSYLDPFNPITGSSQ